MLVCSMQLDVVNGVLRVMKQVFTIFKTEPTGSPCSSGGNMHFGQLVSNVHAISACSGKSVRYAAKMGKIQ